MSRRRGRRRAPWEHLERHARLNFAVLACLVAVLVLALALVVAVRTVAAGTDTEFARVQQWSAASSDAAEVGAILGGWTGSGDDVRAALVDSLADLSARVATLDTDDTPVAVGLPGLLETVRGYIDRPSAQRAFFEAQLRDLGGRFVDLAEELAAAGRLDAESALGHLHGWLVGIQIVAGAAALMFVVVVGTQILPLTRSIDASLSKLKVWNERAEIEGRRRTLSHQVIEGLEVAADEAGAYVVIERALAVAAPGRKAEMLLADSSRAHLRAAVVHPEQGGPGCGVVSPWSCPAVRRGTTQVFADSTAIRACPHLSRSAEPVSAVCAPMTFMGEPLGVLHVTAPVDDIPNEEHLGDLAMLAGEAATRIGTLRAFARAEFQATTDVVTGLANRRATEQRLHTLLADAAGGSAAVVEISGISDLRDRMGKAAGDRAVKVAAQALGQSLREDDWCGRWAGSEFVVILPDLDASAARGVVERLARDVAASFAAADISGLEVAVGLADTRMARTADAMMQLIGAELDAGPREESSKILRPEQLSTG